jgi:hypothetical protein
MVRTPTLGSVFYAPGDPSAITTLPDLVRFVRDENLKLSAAITALALGHIDVSHVAPAKPRNGDIRYASGAPDWDPGSGAGIYYYNGSAWVFIG